MARRDLLHRSKLKEFVAWLGDRALEPVGEWEVARWKGPAGQPMRIVFDNCRSSEHLSCNDAAYPDVRAFIESCKVKSGREAALAEVRELYSRLKALEKSEELTFEERMGLNMSAHYIERVLGRWNINSEKINKQKVEG